MRFIKTLLICVTITPCFAFTIRSRTPWYSRDSLSLHMVNEIIEGANGALDALPLLAGPAAAFAAGQSALQQKKKIEAEVEFAENELEEVKRKLKNTDTLINGSFGLAVISAGFVASQAFGGATLPQTTADFIQDAQEFVLPSSSQQVAVESSENDEQVGELKPTLETMSEVKESDTKKTETKSISTEASTSDVKSASSDSIYNSLFKSIESAGKAVGQAVESNKAAELLSQVPITAAIATKDISEGKIVQEIVPSAVQATIEKSIETVSSSSGDTTLDVTTKAPPVEKGSISVVTETNPTKIVTDEIIANNEKDTISKIQPMEQAKPTISVDSTANVMTQVDKDALPQKDIEVKNEKISPSDVAKPITPSVTSTTKLTPIQSSAADTETNKILNQNVDPVVNAGKEIMQSSDGDTKASADANPDTEYDALFKKIEAAGKSPVESSKADNVQVLPKESTSIPLVKEANGIANSNGDGSKETSDESTISRPITIAPVSPSSASTAVKPPDVSSGMYMKEIAPALTGIGRSKLSTASPKITPDISLPNFKAPELALPNFDFNELKIPNMNLPELKIPTITVPDLKIPGIDVPSLDDIPLAAKAAGAVAVGGVAVAVAVTFGDKESVGSTMPVGGKKKGTTYLEGLSRSSTTMPSKTNTQSQAGSTSGSNSYLNKLVTDSTPTTPSPAAKAFDFAPKPFDPNIGPSTNNPRPSVSAVQESGTSPSFNFKPRVNNPTTELGSSNSNSNRSVNGNDNANGSSSDGNKQLQSQSFNFAPKTPDPSVDRRDSPFRPLDSLNGGSRNAEKPEPPMGEGQANPNYRNDKFDWSSDVNGGYVWRDPVSPQKSSPGVSYLDNLSASDSQGAPLDTKSNNSYLDAMNRQQGVPNVDSVAALEQTWSNSPKPGSFNQQYQDSTQPTTIKTFSKIPRTGSYVDSL